MSSTRGRERAADERSHYFARTDYILVKGEKYCKEFLSCDVLCCDLLYVVLVCLLSAKGREQAVDERSHHFARKQITFLSKARNTARYKILSCDKRAADERSHQFARKQITCLSKVRNTVRLRVFEFGDVLCCFVR